MRELRRRDLLLVALTLAAGAVDAVALLRLDVFTSAVEAAIALEAVLESLGTEELYAWPPGLEVRPR